MSVAIAAAALAVGLALGALAGLLVRLRARLARRPLRSGRRFALECLAVIIALHSWLVLYAMARAPQLYTEAWYAPGGLRRTTLVLVTDHFGPAGVAWLGAIVLLAYLAGPLSSWHWWPERLRRAFVPRTRTGATRGALVGAALVALVMGVACFPRPRASAKRSASPRPNVLVIAADSLRADHVTPDLTPTLSAIAARGTRFERAYVSLPRTFPSWVTLLTGRHPHHHGIRFMFPRWEERAKDFDALPARLAAAGYETAVVSDYAGDIFGRIDLGFRTVHAPSFDFRQLVRQRALERQTPLLPVVHSRLGRAFFPVLREQNNAADPAMLTRDALAVLDRLGDRPFFLTVFFSTAHFPYAAPAPYYGRYTNPSYRGRFKYHKPVGLGHEATVDARDVAQVRALYRGAVASVDDAVADLLLGLEQRGIADNTIVVVTADHGEALYEHGHGLGHGDHLFGDEGTHVPMIVSDPRRKGGGRVPAIVRDVDLAATLYDLTQVPPPPDLDGRSLAPALDGHELPPAFAYAETGLWFTQEVLGLSPSRRFPYPGIATLTEIDTEHGDEIVLRRAVRPVTLLSKHRMVRDERWKLVYVPTRAGIEYLLFDTIADPREVHDVSGEHRDVVARLKTELWAWMRKDPSMTERGGFLVPRAIGEERSSETDRAIRLEGPSGATQASKGGT